MKKLVTLFVLCLATITIAQTRPPAPTFKAPARVKKSIVAPAATTAPTSPGNHQVQLTWTQSTGTGITGNNVYWYTLTSGSCVTTGPFTSLFNSATPITTYTELNVSAGTYCYAVTAVAGSVESPYSAPAQAVVTDVLTVSGLTARQTQ